MKNKWKHNPGSYEAMKAGCICAVIDNCHGEGYHHWPGKPEKKRVWAITGGCPLHAKQEINQEAEREIEQEAESEDEA